MPRRQSFLSTDTLKRQDDLSFRQQLEDGVASLRFESLLDTGIKSLRETAFGDATRTEWASPQQASPDPLPMVVTERPSIRQPSSPMPQQSEQPQSYQPAPAAR